MMNKNKVIAFLLPGIIFLVICTSGVRSQILPTLVNTDSLNRLATSQTSSYKLKVFEGTMKEPFDSVSRKFICLSASLDSWSRLNWCEVCTRGNLVCLSDGQNKVVSCSVDGVGGWVRAQFPTDLFDELGEKVDVYFDVEISPQPRFYGVDLKKMLVPLDSKYDLPEADKAWFLEHYKGCNESLCDN